MAQNDLARVDGEDESSRGLLSSFVKSRDTKQTKTVSKRYTWCYFIAALLVLQVLVLWRFFFRPEVSIAAGPPYNQTETVELVTAWYQLLQEMRYLGSDMVAYPPHTGANAINITLAEQVLGLDERVVQTLLALPYVIPHEDKRDSKTGEYLKDTQITKAHEHSATWWQGWMGQDRDIIWRGGHFIDYRNDTNLLRSRTPFGNLMAMVKVRPLNSQSGSDRGDSSYSPIPPTSIPLSMVTRPRYGVSLILDVASNRIVAVDSQTRGNGDPFFQRFEHDKIPSFYHIPKIVFHGRERDARLAPDVLRDFIGQTAKLSFIPGSVRPDERYTPELSPPLWEKWVRDVYRGLGWPNIEPLEECHWLPLHKGSSNCDHDPYGNFKRTEFDKLIREVRHNITTKYMSDWYCPVPRDHAFIEEIKMKNPTTLSKEQVAYAESNEPVIPQNYENDWAKRLFWNGARAQLGTG